jgi:hypothetical protein
VTFISSSSTKSTPKGWNRSRYVDRLAITIVQIDHRSPPAQLPPIARTPRTSPSRRLMIFVVDAPVRGSPSSQATTTAHRCDVPLLVAAKNAAPLPFATPSRRCNRGVRTCPPRHAPSSTYRHPARSSTQPVPVGHCIA